MDDPGFETRQGQEIFIFYESSRPTLGSTKLLVQCIPGFFPGGKAAETWNWPLHLAPRLRMSGVIPLLPLYAYVTWHGHFNPLDSPVLMFWRYWCSTQVVSSVGSHGCVLQPAWQRWCRAELLASLTVEPPTVFGVRRQQVQVESWHAGDTPLPLLLL